MIPITFDQPNASPEIPWETMGKGKTTSLRRVKVPGGWLYQTKEKTTTGGTQALAFVSTSAVLNDPTVSDEQKIALGLITPTPAQV